MTTAIETLPQLTNDEVQRYSRHLIMPEVGMEGQSQLKAGERAVHRRGRARLAHRDVSRGRRHRQASASWISTWWTSQPAAADHPRTPMSGRSKLASAKGSARDSIRIVDHRHLRDRALVGERARSHSALRHRRGRHGQFPDALSRQRRLRAAQEAERLRQHLPLRGAGERVCAPKGGPCYRCLYPGTAAAGHGARVARKAACSACCPASSATSRRPRS